MARAQLALLQMQVCACVQVLVCHLSSCLVIVRVCLGCYGKGPACLVADAGMCVCVQVLVCHLISCLVIVRVCLGCCGKGPACPAANAGACVCVCLCVLRCDLVCG